MRSGHRICRAGLLLLHELREPFGGAVEGMAVERSVKGEKLGRFTCLLVAFVKTAATSGELAVLPGTSLRK